MHHPLQVESMPVPSRNSDSKSTYGTDDSISTGSGAPEDHPHAQLLGRNRRGAEAVASAAAKADEKMWEITNLAELVEVK